MGARSRSIGVVIGALLWALGGARGAGAQVEPPGTGAPELVRSALAAGRYEDADRSASAWLATVERQFATDSLEAADALNLLAMARLRNGRSAQADTVSLAQRAVDIHERRQPADVRSQAASLDTLGLILTDRGELNQALPLLQNSLALRRRSGEASDVADGCDHLASALIRQQRYEQADRLLGEARGLRAEGAASDLATANTLFVTATLRSTTVGTRRVRPYWNACWPSANGCCRPTIRTSVSRFSCGASCRFFWATSVQRDPIGSQALSMAERSLRPGHPDFASVLRFLSIASRHFGDLTSARQLMQRALPIAEQSLSECHQDRANLLGESAEIERDVGNYLQSQKMNAAALALYQKCLTPNDQRIATNIHNQALVAADMGDLALAERLQRDAVRRWTNGLGPTHPYVARGLDALAEVVASRGRTPAARTLYEQALQLRMQTLGSDHPDVAWTLTNIAEMLSRSGAAAGALARVRSAITIYQRVGAGDEPDHMARALALRGRLELGNGTPEIARGSFEEALGLRTTIFGENHPLVAEAEVDLARADLMAARPGVALEEALASERIGRDHLRFTIRYLPERQAMAYADKRPRGLDVAISIAAAQGDVDVAAVADQVIQSRAVILDELAARARLAVGASSEMESLSDTVAAARARFAKLMLRSIEEPGSVSRAMLDAASRQKEDAERALAERSLTDRAEVAHAQVGLNDVRRALPAGAVLVSFVRYDRTAVTTRQGRPVLTLRPAYLAFIVSNVQANVEVVPLGGASVVESLISAWRREASGQTLLQSPTDALRAYRSAGAQLRQKIWDPLQPYLAGASHVFVVPDGAINLVSFEALPTGPSRTSWRAAQSFICSPLSETWCRRTCRARDVACWRSGALHTTFRRRKSSRQTCCARVVRARTCSASRICPAREPRSRTSRASGRLCRLRRTPTGCEPPTSPS